jgi:hypothetical protein
MSIITSLGKKKYPEDVLAELLTKRGDLTDAAFSKQILMRLSRAYSHAIIDGTDYILVPQIQHAPTTTPNAHIEKAAA